MKISNADGVEFEQAVTVPAATLDGHAINKGQADDAYGVLASLHLTNQSASIAKTTLVADAPAGIYRISCLIHDLMTGSASSQVLPLFYLDGSLRNFVFYDSDTQLHNAVALLTGNNEWSSSVIVGRSTTVADIEYRVYHYEDGDYDIDFLVERLE